MPIYEFRCEGCGAGFEALVDAGKTAVQCVECGDGPTRRVYSPQAPSPRLVKTRRGRLKQERANAGLREGAKARFKAARARAAGRPDGKR